MKTWQFQCKTSDFANASRSKFFSLGAVRNWCWHYCPMGKGRDQFLSRSVPQISKSFLCIYFPLIKNNFKKPPLARNSLCVPSSTRRNTCSSFPPDKHFAERQACTLCSDGCSNRREICPLSPWGCVWSALSQGHPCHLSPCPPSGLKIRCL